MACPTNSLSGDTEFRRSHIWSVGERSSSEATISCVATSGFHWRTDARRWLQRGEGGEDGEEGRAMGSTEEQGRYRQAGH